MNIITKTIIFVLHIIFAMYILLAPLIANSYLLLVYIIVVPFIMIHWITDSNVCALTIMERKLRGISDSKNDETFFGNLIDPIYRFRADNPDWSVFIFALFICLWCLSINKISANFSSGKINSLYDMIKY